MLDDEQMQRLRSAFRTHSFFLNYVSTHVKDVLEEIIDHPRFPGASDPSALLMLATLAHEIRPARVLQLGTHIGFSTILLGDILAQHEPAGVLVTVDPDASAHELARHWVESAGLKGRVTFLTGYSTDPAICQAIADLRPFDLIYLDSSHAYESTLTELDLIVGQDGWLADRGLLLLHDAAFGAAQWDPTNQGGVRRALEEWTAQHPGRSQLLVMEPPLWPNICGFGLMMRRPDQGADSVELTATSIDTSRRMRIAELEQLVASKNEHIQRLESLLHRIQAGRVLRLLRWLQR